MAKRKKKASSDANTASGKKRGPGRPPGTGTGKYKKAKRGPGRPPGTGTGTYKKSKRGSGRPPGTGTGTYKKAKRGPGRPPGTGTGTYNKSKRGPGRPKATRGPGRPPKSDRGPGRPLKTHSLEGVRITDRDLGKLLDLQSMILDIQRTHFKKSGKFDLSLTKQFSENFKTVDRIVDILSKKG